MGEVERRIDTALRAAVRQRNYRRIRDRALARLRANHEEEYLTLLEQERARDEQEEKAWLDISGRTNASVGLPTTNAHADRVAKRLGNQATPRNNGGKA